MHVFVHSDFRHIYVSSSETETYYYYFFNLFMKYDIKEYSLAYKVFWWGSKNPHNTVATFVGQSATFLFTAIGG